MKRTQKRSRRLSEQLGSAQLTRVTAGNLSNREDHWFGRREEAPGYQDRWGGEP